MRTIPELQEGTHRAKASGTLPNGKPVVVNADGTVSVVAEVSVPASAGTPATAVEANVEFTEVTYDVANDKIVAVYTDPDDSDAAFAVVGTVSGSSISWGTPVEFASQGGECSCAYDELNEKVVVVYSDGGNSGYGTARVGTVSGTSISFGSADVYNSGDSRRNRIACGNDGRCLVVYKDVGASNYGKIVVGNVSGTSINFGGEGNLNNSATNDLEVVYASGYSDPSGNSNVFGVFYRGTSNHGRARVCYFASNGTNNVTIGNESTFNSAQTNIQGPASYDTSNDKFVVVYGDGGNSNYPTAIVGTVVYSGIDPTMTFGTEVVIKSSESYDAAAAYQASSQKHIIAFSPSPFSSGDFVVGTVSGTSISFSTSVQFSSAYAATTDVTYDSGSEQVVAFYRDSGDGNKPKGVMITSAYTSANLTSENYIGMSGGVVSSETVTQALGSDVVFNAASSTFTATTYDENAQKVVISYRDGGNSNYGTAVVGTVSGTSISFGTPVVFESAATARISITYDSNAQKVVVVYQDQGNSNRGTAAVGTVSGTSISFGTPVVFESGDTRDTTCVYHAAGQKVVIAYKDQGNSSYGTAIVGTVSGTSISFGGASIFNAAESQYNSLSYDSANEKVVISYTDSGNSGYGTAIVGTVSGTSISFGSESVFESASTTFISSAYDVESGTIVVSYTDAGNSSYGTAIVGTISGTSISFGTPVVFENANTGSKFAAYDSAAKKVVIAYQDVGNTDNGTFITGTVSGTSISFASPVVFDTGFASDISASYDSNSQKVVVGYVDYDNSIYGTSVVFQPAYTNVIRGQVNAGSSATVDIIGSVSTNQSGLTSGQSYYVQTDGTIGETAADPSVFAGTAISATSLVVKT